MGKTETIKQRAIWVYLGSLEQKDRWEDIAKKQGTSLSKFVAEHVENSLAQEQDSDYTSRTNLIEEVRRLREESEEIKRDNRILRTAYDRLEKELKRYRAQPFLEEDYTGVRRYSKELASLLRTRGMLTSEEILGALGVKPGEHEMIQTISKQLENLEKYGLVQSSPRGWKWREPNADK